MSSLRNRRLMFNQSPTPDYNGGMGTPIRDTKYLYTRLAFSTLLVAGAPVGIIAQPLSEIAPSPTPESNLEKALGLACTILELVVNDGAISLPRLKESVEALHNMAQNAQKIQSVKSEYEDLAQRACNLVYGIVAQVNDINLSPACLNALKIVL
ncbi:hypothetical protein AX16_007827, partial [Volvariella volvacea WC 439]